MHLMILVSEFSQNWSLHGGPRWDQGYDFMRDEVHHFRIKSDLNVPVGEVCIVALSSRANDASLSSARPR
ncbi:unnamed protein product, partial [Mesorhabditis belari]|uniref:Uncharacterized protein n=1 Tax=Mesorhabditis belari TaxID=2138241 RepID=A0AAF3EHS4_9BILA